MKAIAALLALAAGLTLAQSQPRYLDAASAVVTLQDGGVVRVDGGAWLSDVAIDEGFAERLKLRAENDYLKAHAGELEVRRTTELMGGSFAVGGTSGLTVRALVLPAVAPK